MILADINIDGASRKVILHAPKNGFFFVIDRTNGKFISAKNFVDVNWATGYDANGRPIEVAEARGDKPFDSIPGPYGAHNWHPISFNPQTGLVYIPAQNIPVNLTGDKDWTHNSNIPGQPHSGLGWNLGYFANVEPPTAIWSLDRLGPGQAAASLEAGLCVAMERRHPDDRRQSGVPGLGGRTLYRLQRYIR